MASHWNNNIDLYHALPTFLENDAQGFNPYGFSIDDKEIVIELNETTDDNPYVLDWNFLLNNHDITIKGKGVDKTKLVFYKNVNLHNDDSVLNFRGSFGNEINVKITDLSIESIISPEDVIEDMNTDFGDNKMHMAVNNTYVIKCYHVKSLVMRNVCIKVQNVKTTCLDIRRGSNIDISCCTFANYNACSAGGNIWLRGDLRDVSIRHCDFYKFGADEMIGIWGSNNFQGENEIPGNDPSINEIHKKNIHITHNRIYCQSMNGDSSGVIINEGESQTWNGSCERFITVYTTQKDNKVKNENDELIQRDVPCSYFLSDIKFTDNEIYINAPVFYLFTIALDKHTAYKDIAFDNNIIRYGTWTLKTNRSLVDFNVLYDTQYDYSQIPGDYNLTSDEPFSISGNTIYCGSNMYYEQTKNGATFSVDNHICLLINGTIVLFNNNLINCTRSDYSEDENKSAHKGLELFNSSPKGGTVIFNDNHCEGLKLLLRAASSSTISLINLYGRGNYLYGDTRIIYSDVVESHVSLIGNEFICDYQLLLVSEFANQGTVVFNGNRVYRDITRVTYYTNPKGQIFYTGKTNSTSNIQSMRFVCCGNIFDNLLYSTVMFNNFQIVDNIRAIHSNNIFADYYDE